MNRSKEIMSKEITKSWIKKTIQEKAKTQINISRYGVE